MSFTSHIELMDQTGLKFATSNNFSDNFMTDFEYAMIIAKIMNELEKTTAPSYVNLQVKADEILRGGDAPLTIKRIFEDGSFDYLLTNKMFIPHSQIPNHNSNNN